MTLSIEVDETAAKFIELNNRTRELKIKNLFDPNWLPRVDTSQPLKYTLVLDDHIEKVRFTTTVNFWYEPPVQEKSLVNKKNDTGDQLQKMNVLKASMDLFGVITLSFDPEIISKEKVIETLKGDFNLTVVK